MAITIALICDSCGRHFVEDTSNGNTTIAAAVKAGWRVSTNRKEGSDLCAKCLAKALAKTLGDC